MKRRQTSMMHRWRHWRIRSQLKIFSMDLHRKTRRRRPADVSSTDVRFRRDFRTVAVVVAVRSVVAPGLVITERGRWRSKIVKLLSDPAMLVANALFAEKRNGFVEISIFLFRTSPVRTFELFWLFEIRCCCCFWMFKIWSFWALLMLLLLLLLCLLLFFGFFFFVFVVDVNVSGDDDVELSRLLLQRSDGVVDVQTAKTFAADVDQFVADSQSAIPETITKALSHLFTTQSHSTRFRKWLKYCNK